MKFLIKMMVRSVVIIVLLMLGTFAYGQSSIVNTDVVANNATSLGNVKKAEKKFDNFSFVNARALYLKIANKGNTSPEVLKKLGDSYYFTSEYNEAVKWYEKLINNNEPSAVSPEYYFRYAQSLKSLERYDDADKVMNTFEELNANDARAEMFAKQRKYLEDIANKSGQYVLKKNNINSPFQDFSPAFYGDSLVFSSNRENRTGNLIHDWNDQPFSDLFIVDNAEDATPAIRLFEGELNTDYHESSAAFNKAKDVMYFTRNNFTDEVLERDKSGINNLKIYRSFLKDGKWGKAEELPFNSHEYSVAHPALSVDETVLFFVSDMPGTKGLSDIWKVSIGDDGGFGKPQNLGETINTASRETFPFVTKDNELFFATDGHVGLGGLDIFMATIDANGTLSEPSNIGKPINSSFDDFGVILDKDKKIGYFSSNRNNGMGNDDIYSFEIIECNQVISGITKNKKTDEVLPLAKIELRDAQNTIIKQIQSDKTGNFIFDNIACNTTYMIRVLKDHYDTVEEIVNTTNSKKLERSFYLSPFIENKVGDDLAKNLQLQPIYFDYDKSFIRADAKKELVKVIAFMEQYPNAKVEVRSHTDSRSNDAYNASLSDKRAAATVAYIISKGIAKNRLTSKGYGESQLVNSCKNKVPCTDQEHESNRRSEFIILSK